MTYDIYRKGKTHLKVKILSLGAEARIIKFQEHKWLKTPFYHENVKVPHPLYISLRNHRLYEVRTECRHANIAYGWMRGRQYKQIENKCHQPPNLASVVKIIDRFSNGKYSYAPAREELLKQLRLWVGLLNTEKPNG